MICLQIATIFIVLYPAEMSAQCANDVTTGTASIYRIEPEILDHESGTLTSPGYPEGISERVRHGKTFLLKFCSRLPEIIPWRKSWLRRE